MPLHQIQQGYGIVPLVDFLFIKMLLVLRIPHLDIILLTIIDTVREMLRLEIVHFQIIQRVIILLRMDILHFGSIPQVIIILPMDIPHWVGILLEMEM